MELRDNQQAAEGIGHLQEQLLSQQMALQQLQTQLQAARQDAQDAEATRAADAEQVGSAQLAAHGHSNGRHTLCSEISRISWCPRE